MRRFSDFADLDRRPLDVLAELRRHMDQVWTDYETEVHPRLTLADSGEALVIQADLPGVADKDVDITLHDGVLALTAERKVAVPDGFKALRQERAGFRFSRSIALPCKVDPEKSTATTKDGVLTVVLAKAEEARPRQIHVRVES